MTGPEFRWPHPDSFPEGDHELGSDASREEKDLGKGQVKYLERNVLPLRDVVLFPNMITPLYVDHEPSLNAITESYQRNESMIAITQVLPELHDPTPSDLHMVGTEIMISRIMSNPDGSTSILTEGQNRVQVAEYVQTDPFLKARAQIISEKHKPTNRTLALMRVTRRLFERCVQLNRSLPEEAYLYAANIESPGWLADLITSSISLTISERQAVLEIFQPLLRLEHVNLLLKRELEVLELEDQIHSQTQQEFDRTQREGFLREQMRVIQTELGEGDIWSQELTELKERVEHLNLPEEVEARTLKEISRLNQMPPLSPEVGIIRTYLDWLTELPWSSAREDNLNVRNAKKVLERDHYGLQKAKERILEYIAVRKLAPTQHRQPILCFVGAPGTGKTSLGKSIAEALNRKFTRISLGGIRDEAEIRGHRRTYIGALPGRIIQGMRRVGTTRPLFMLDEIDKLGRDFRGDPASALLEVLDPEQNHGFSDHYLEIPYDLSNVMFITTANTTDTIPAALLDRMEVIEFPSYTQEEKLIIGTRFLIPRQMEQNGLQEGEITIPDETLNRIIREYTWEAGVRNLEREIGKVCRKMARRKAEGRQLPREVTSSSLSRLLGPSQVHPQKAEKKDQIGAATALVWTENGGDTMPIEVLLVSGKGGYQITGQIGEVMQESAQAAISYVKSRINDFGLDPEIFENSDLHIHVPEGSIPKDGPSAGVTMAVALTSVLTGRPVRKDIGMTGEITLRGRILPVGGIREKYLAAYRLPLQSVVLPKANKKDLVDVPKEAKNALHIHFVDHMDEVIELAVLPGKLKPPRNLGSSTRSESTAGISTSL